MRKQVWFGLSAVFCCSGVYADLPTLVLKSRTNQQQTQIGFATQSIQDIPASLTSINADRIETQHAKTLTDVVKNDASVGDSYAAIGYYPNFNVRGFALDSASSYLINGNVVRGEQNIPLENKSNVEILKGISAMQSGMSTPGGIVNYVTKRPANVRHIAVDVDQHGDTTTAIDMGSKNSTWGYRVNVAHEDINSYVKGVNGKRNLGSLALDWTPSDQSTITFDFETQQQQQRSVPGYQLLDGQVPTHVDAKRLLAAQSWSKPVDIQSINTNLKYLYQLNSQWQLASTIAYSRVVVDDYSAFPWVCYSDICSTQGSTFDRQGNYDIYDYRNPDDTYTTMQLKTGASGQINNHHLDLELGYLNKEHRRYEGINEWVGTGNIDQDPQDYAQSTSGLGKRYKALQSQQIYVSGLDKITLNDFFNAWIGGKILHLDEDAYPTRHTQMNKFLPQLALMYTPRKNTNFYVSYAKGLSDGKTAPWYANNADETLTPIRSSQYEVGLKQQINQFFVNLAIFNLKQDNQYTDKNLQFIQSGIRQSQGVELALTGKLLPSLETFSTLTYTKTRLKNVAYQNLENHQLQNSPSWRFATYLAYNIEQFKLFGGMQAVSSKYANKTASAKVAGYTTFNAGINYRIPMVSTKAVIGLNVDNILNKTYWRDVGGYMGDDYMFLGAPRNTRLSLSFDF